MARAVECWACKNTARTPGRVDKSTIRYLAQRFVRKQCVPQCMQQHSKPHPGKRSASLKTVAPNVLRLSFTLPFNYCITTPWKCSLTAA